MLRTSHHDQFDWMEHNFSVKLRENLSIWPKFIELCERRNLLTHTGGVVSKQYIDICRKHKCDTVETCIGAKLSVDSEYFSTAVRTIYEIGVKLCYVLWHKFEPALHEVADRRLNELGYDLIYRRAYNIAEPVLRFGAEVVSIYKGNELTRRMMIVNLANAMRLQDRKDDAKKLLDKEDWSACSDEFKLCTAAVTGNVTEVLAIMRRIGTSGSPNMEAYGTWPVFLGIRTDERFMALFEELFGEPVIAAQQAAVAELPNSVPVPSPTKH